jgi:hypothetical protein
LVGRRGGLVVAGGGGWLVVAAAWLLQASAGLLVGLRVTCRVTSVEDLYKEM